MMMSSLKRTEYDHCMTKSSFGIVDRLVGDSRAIAIVFWWVVSII
jgi:hypothetical protein